MFKKTCCLHVFAKFCFSIFNQVRSRDCKSFQCSATPMKEVYLRSKNMHVSTHFTNALLERPLLSKDFGRFCFIAVSQNLLVTKGIATSSKKLRSY